MTSLKKLDRKINKEQTMKIIGVYKITNTVTGDFYVGSSKNIKQRWSDHKCPSTWKEWPNRPMYLAMQRYGIDKFNFQVLAEVEIEHLKEAEQKFIETLKPTYNQVNANGIDFGRYKKAQKKYNKSDKGKKAQNKYRQSKKCKESNKKYQNKYNNQLCLYNGETLTLCALRSRFAKKGFDHPTLEAKKYLL